MAEDARRDGRRKCLRIAAKSWFSAVNGTEKNCSRATVGLSFDVIAGREIFVQHVVEILERHFRQNGQGIPPISEITGVADRAWALILDRGLPRPLGKSERGEPGEMSDAECAPLLERVLPDASSTWREPLANPVKQLVKACFYPEFKTCRNSFREVSPDGSCRRQELSRARMRVGGSHCVDCPHWVALTPEQHAKYLAREWRAGAAAFYEHQSIFLPEDFRALRLFLHRAKRAIPV
ncbi:MAG: hypothetical protein JWM35_2161 [Verrucomicrobia bacterium]|nr:hypothetical protein [Verrucomicrobiota bacterium]